VEVRAVISFEVPAHDEELLLGRTLAAIHVAARRIGQPYEVVVADDASTDRTAAVAMEHRARVVPLARRQIAAARNAGARAAVGDTLIFVDADTIVSAEVAATLTALAGGAIAGGATMRLDGRIPWYGRVLTFVVLAVMRVGRLAAGCYLFCRRDAFEAVGGFDEGLYATEEIALSRALHRHGSVVILREAVETSGRKLRTYSGWEILRLLAMMATPGRRVVRSRRHLDLWYGGRRTDPGGGTVSGSES
jgi:glycosyltransferase involved in cell wall biosynthesis